MEKFILSNGVRVVYEQRKGNITSFCIGFNAGSLEERGYNLGIAHAVEHMLFKGTEKRSESEINKLCDEIFGFNNAMTNFPYAIYYGTVNSEEFERGFELYSDLLLKPSFPEVGFKEEISVILEELKDWEEDLAQHCEDLMLYNAFSGRRIKNLIIGEQENIQNITLDEIKNFYDAYYAPENCVVSVVTSLDRNSALDVVRRYIGDWSKNFKGIESTKYEENKPGIFCSNAAGTMGAKIAYCLPIHNLNHEEIEKLNLFNLFYGEGVSSILYDEIRTKQGLAYEVVSTIKNERGIKLFTIYVSTSVNNIEKAITIIDDSLAGIKTAVGSLDSNFINIMARRLRLKRELAIEKSIELSKKLTTYELMYEKAERIYEELDSARSITGEEIAELLDKIIKKPTIQIIR